MNELNPEWPNLEGFPWPDEPPRTDPLRGALLEATCRVVRARRRRRRARLMASWSAAYIAGLTTAWFAWRGDRPVARPLADRAPSQLALAQAAAERSPEPVPAVEQPPEEFSPEELRSRVFGAPRLEQIRLLRLAGDQYLYGRADVASALDCYRQVIELTPPAKLAERRAEDSWLLAELKSSAANLAMDDD